MLQQLQVRHWKSTFSVTDKQPHSADANQSASPSTQPSPPPSRAETASACSLAQSTSVPDLGRLRELSYTFRFPRGPPASGALTNLNNFCFGADTYPDQLPQDMRSHEWVICACDGIGRDFIAMSWPLPSARDQYLLAERMLSDEVLNVEPWHRLSIDSSETDHVALALLMGLSRTSMARAPDNEQPMSSSRRADMQRIGGMPELLEGDMLVEDTIGTLPGGPTEPLFGSSCNIPAPSLQRATPRGKVRLACNRPASFLVSVPHIPASAWCRSPAASSVNEQKPSAAAGDSTTLKADVDRTSDRTEVEEVRWPAGAAASPEEAASKGPVPFSKDGRPCSRSPRRSHDQLAHASTHPEFARQEHQRRADVMAAALIEEEEKEKQASLKRQVHKSRKKQTTSSKKKGKAAAVAQPPLAETQQPMSALQTVKQTPLSGPVWQNLISFAQLQRAQHTNRPSAGATAGFTPVSEPATQMLQQPGVGNLTGWAKPLVFGGGDKASASVQGLCAEPQNDDSILAPGSQTSSPDTEPQEAALPALHKSNKAHEMPSIASRKSRKPEQLDPPSDGMVATSAGSPPQHENWKFCLSETLTNDIELAQHQVYG